MPPVLELVMSLLGGGDTLDKLASLTGADDAAQASDAARLSAPAILGGLAERTQGESGLETVMGMLDDNRPVLDDLGGFLDKAETEAGNTVLDFLFAGDRADLVSGLAAKAELGGPVIGKLLPMLAPAVAAVVANERNLQELDGPGLAAMLNSETAAMDRDGILYAVTDFPPPTAVTAGVAAMAGAAGIGAAGIGSVNSGSAISGSVNSGSVNSGSVNSGSMASASGTVGDGLDGVAGTVDSAGDAAGGAVGNAGDAAAGVVGSAGDAAGDAVGSVGSAAAGAASGAVDKVGDVLGGAAGAVDGAAEGVTESVADAAGAAAEKAGDAKEAVTAGVKGAFGGGNNSGDEGGGLGWLWWAIGAVALVLLLAWLLSQCNDEDAASSGTNTTEVSVDADDDSADDDASAEADDTDGDDSDGTDTDSDADAAEDDADGNSDAESALQELVDGTLRGTGVAGAVSDGEVTLTGTVDDGDASDEAEAAIAAIEGVESVDNQIEVDGADPSSDGSDSDGAADLDAGDTINELLDLDPVTFRVSSATITDAGTAVLDEAAEFLENNGDIEVEIGGHTDSDGATAENLDLSERRAEAVKVYLEGKGIDGDRMTTRGYGESEPKVPNTSAEGKAENRRIEFTVL